MRGSYKFITLKVATAYRLLQATALGHGLSVQAKYVLLKASAITGHFLTFLNFDDSTTLTDQQAIAFGKQIDEIVSAVEQISLNTGKTFSDSATATDVLTLVMNFVRSFTDSVTATDAKTISFSGVQADSVTGADSITSIAFTKFLADTLTTVDSLAITSGETKQDAVAIDDIGALDHPVMNIGKSLTDSTTSSDSGVLFIQDYCDITYFLEDYVGTSRTF
jgi:hypothetical protein